MKYFISVLFGIFSYSSALGDIPASCIHAAPHDSVTFLLVDRTDIRKDAQGFSQLMGVLRENLRTNERFLAAVVTNHANSARLMVDAVKPENSMWKSLLKSRKESKEFAKCLEEFHSALSQSAEVHEASAILETLAFASEVFKGDSAGKKRIVLYSDMLQNSEMVSFYKQKNIDPGAMLAKAKRNGLVKDLTGVQLFLVTNSGTLGEKRDRQIEKFWREYAKATKSNLKLYGPALTNFVE